MQAKDNVGSLILYSSRYAHIHKAKPPLALLVLNVFL
jgi:hypothetical protein